MTAAPLGGGGLVTIASSRFAPRSPPEMPPAFPLDGILEIMAWGPPVPSRLASSPSPKMGGVASKSSSGTMSISSSIQYLCMPFGTPFMDVVELAAFTAPPGAAIVSPSSRKLTI